MNRYDTRTAELRRVPAAMAEKVPSPRPQADRPQADRPHADRPHADHGASGWYPYSAPPRPRFTPRIQYTPRVRSPRPPGFYQPPTEPFARLAPPQSTIPQPALPHAAPPRQPARYYQRQPARAVIGDALRVPILWCDFGSCIERFTHVDALGEHDLRFRALAAGWRYDLLGRLACPSCVQHDPAFWMTRPPVPVPRRY